MPEPGSCQGRDLVQVGTVTGVFGLKGWVKVFSYTDPIESIVDYQPWLIKRGESEQLAEVAQARCQSKKIQVRMRGYDTRDQAEALVGMEPWFVSHSFIIHPLHSRNPSFPHAVLVF